MDLYKRTYVCTYNTNIKLLMGIIIRALRERRKRGFGSFVMYDPPPVGAAASAIRLVGSKIRRSLIQSISQRGRFSFRARKRFENDGLVKKKCK